MCDGIKSDRLLPYFFVFMMAFSGGFADAASFILIGVFSGHLTGNSILSLIRIIEGDYSALFISILALIGFIAGTLSGIIWRRNILHAKNMYLPIILQLVLVIVVVAVKKTLGETVASTYIFAIGLSFSLGVQNGVYTHIVKASIHTTYITGVTTSLFEGLLYPDNTNSDKVFSRKIFAILSSAFVLGAGVGAFVSHHFGVDGFMLIIPLIFISAVVCFLYTNRCA